MTAQLAETGDYLARACFPKPLVDQAIKVEYLATGKPKVYKRRFFIIIAFCLGYFTWNFHSYRTAPLVAEYALYYNQPNELKAPPDLGIDFLLIFDSFLLIFFYPIAGVLVDSYGISTMIFGAVGQALSAWWWYLSFKSYWSVVFSKLLANFSGACIASTLLRVSNNWFPEDERAVAVAAGAIFASFGSGAALVIAPLFASSEAKLNLAIISCREDELSGINVTEAVLLGQCPDIARDAFCCAADINLDSLNLFFAFWTSAVAAYTVLCVKDSPPTPPSKAGIIRKGPTMRKALEIFYSKKNYLQICLTDFLSSGPPIVLFSTVSRIFPATVSDYANLASSLAFVLAIPLGGYYSYQLAKHKSFYELTAAGYTAGFLSWLFVTGMVFVGTKGADIMVLLAGVVAVVCYVVWTVSVYELKIEYVFTPEYAIQGYVVAMDRTIINLAAVVYLAAIPPERYEGPNLSGREFSFIIGAISMMAGMFLALTIKDKYAYNRMKYELETGETVAEILNVSQVYSKPPEELIRTLLPSQTEEPPNVKKNWTHNPFFNPEPLSEFILDDEDDIKDSL